MINLLAIVRRVSVAVPLCGVTLGAAVGNAQSQQGFDVVSIKPIPLNGRPTQGWMGIRFVADGVQAASQTLPELLCFAYGYGSVRFDGQVTGLPGWAATQRYDINAKMSPEDAAEVQKLGKDEQAQRRQAMMQALLADRFHLRLHRGSKEIPVYELRIAKGGIKMQDAATDPNPPLKKGEDGKPVTTMRWLEKTSIWQGESMKSLADLLSIPAASVGRPVQDKTGLTGTYDFTFDWSIYSAKAAASDSPGDVPSISTALGELGLKLQPATASYEILIVDHVEMPTEN